MLKKIFIFCSVLNIIIEISICKITILNLDEKKERFKKLEEFYLNNFPAADTDDPVCALDKKKKIALCESIFNFKHFKTLDLELNKTAVYLQKLSCKQEEITIVYTTSSLNNLKLKQRMYHCPGKHSTIHTSLVEDDYYDAFYISAGPVKNSFMVYVHVHDIYDGLNIFDYINNLSISELQDRTITRKEMTTELKLWKDIAITFDYEELTKIYLREQNNLEIDPICNLEYEKKITLCNVVFDKFVYKHMPNITHNKAAVYLLSMQCIIRPIYTVSKNSCTILAKEQKLYPCFGRHKTQEEKNLFTDKFINKIYLSSGPKRNSVYVYVRATFFHYVDVFALGGLIENVNIRLLKPTSVTIDQIRAESETTYAEVLRILNLVEIKYGNRIKSIAHFSASSNLSDDLETKIMQHLQIQHANDYYELFMDSKVTPSSDNIKADDSSKDNSKNIETQSVEESITFDTKDYLQIGLQIFKSMVKIKQEELQTTPSADESNITIKSIEKEVEQRKPSEQKSELLAKKRKLAGSVQKLIIKMESTVAITEVLEQVNKINQTDLIERSNESDEGKNIQLKVHKKDISGTKKKKKKKRSTKN